MCFISSHILLVKLTINQSDLIGIDNIEKFIELLALLMQIKHMNWTLIEEKPCQTGRIEWKCK